MIIDRCSECGEPARLFTVDGTARRLCSECVNAELQIATAQDNNRRFHFAIHGYETFACPVCASEREAVLRRIRAEV